jgi:hypothetical protein
MIIVLVMIGFVGCGGGGGGSSGVGGGGGRLGTKSSPPTIFNQDELLGIYYRNDFSLEFQNLFSHPKFIKGRYNMGNQELFQTLFFGEMVNHHHTVVHLDGDFGR